MKYFTVQGFGQSPRKTLWHYESIKIIHVKTVWKVKSTLPPKKEKKISWCEYMKVWWYLHCVLRAGSPGSTLINCPKVWVWLLHAGILSPWGIVICTKFDDRDLMGTNKVDITFSLLLGRWCSDFRSQHVLQQHLWVSYDV